MAIRTLTFGDPESGLWGAAWALDGGGDGFGLIGDLRASLTDDWRLLGDGVELEVVADGVPSELADGFDELVRVEGRLVERSVQCLGRRGERTALDPADYDSVRDVSAWFAPDDGLALLAARPPGSRGHEDERLTVSAFEAGRSLPISDPRLSTTYAADGSPIRAGIELWFERPDDQQENSDDTVLYPRRAAGEAAGAVARAVTGPLVVEARPFRWHSHGGDGAGVYVLVRPS
jgi:hypothetical protein